MKILGTLIDEQWGYELVLDPIMFGKDSQVQSYNYSVYDPQGNYVSSINSNKDYAMDKADYYNSRVMSFFLTIIKSDKVKKSKEKAKDKAMTSYLPASTNTPIRSTSHADDDAYVGQIWSSGYKSYWQPKEINIEDYCKSNTIVFHLADRSTEMLSQIYEGKGFDVIRESNIGGDNVAQLLQRHERVICLGHGGPSGLIGGNINGNVASYLEGKKLFVIWCNADEYFTHHKIGDGQFITGNMPSEVGECQWAGCGDISRELMLENITYWSKLCADVCEQALGGDAVGAVKYVRENYIRRYGDHPVTIYNAERTKVQGTTMAQNIAEVDAIKKELGFNTPDHVDTPPSYYSSYYWSGSSGSSGSSSKGDYFKPSKPKANKSIEDLFGELYNNNDD